MKKSRRQSLKQKLTVALSVVNALNMAAPVALPYVNVARNVSTTGGHAEPLADNLARALYGRAEATSQTVSNGETSTFPDNPMVSGDRQDIKNGGNGTVETMSGGSQVVSSGGTGTITTMNSGGWQDVRNGGSGTVVTMSGGTQNIQGSGNGTITTMNSGGYQNINASGSGTISTMNGGTQNITSGAIGIIVSGLNSGCTQTVWGGGTAKGTVDNGGILELAHISAVLQDSNGTLINRNEYVLHGGTLRLRGGASITDYTVSNGTLELKYNGIATSTTINSGGVQNVLNGGTADGATIKNGGVQTANEGGVLAGTHTVEAGGSASGGILTGTQNVLSGGTVTEIIVNGTQNIASGGTAEDTTIKNGGVQTAASGGVLGGTQTIEAGGSASGGTLTGTQNVLSGGTVTEIIVSGTQNIASGGTAKDTTINGGTQNVEKGGVASGGTLKSGTQNVASGGTATGMTVSGGIQNIEKGAAVSDTIVKGGTQTVGNGGFASGGALSDGALQIVEAGGTAQGLTLNDGGTQNVYGMAKGATVNSGGSQHIFSGGSAASTMLSGGTITVEDYATAQIDTAVGGMVELLDAGLATAIFGNGAAVGSYTVDTLKARGDTVILGQGDATPSPVGNKLNVGTMDGYANFVVNTDLAHNVSDEIHIGTATNGTKANTVRINYDPTLAAGKTVPNTKTLVATVKQGKAVFEGAESSIGGLKYLPNLVTEDGGASWYIATMEKKGASDGSHHTLMGMTAGMAALSAGNAFIDDASRGLGLMANTGKDGVSTFAKFGGGAIRQETGSHVDVKTWNAILALGHANKKERGTFEYGAFFEYGSGNYTTHENDLRGDGSMRYTGGGVLAKWTANHGFYVEGSLRAGTVHDDASNVLRDDVNTYSYDTNANYFGAHIGVGKEIEVVGGNTVDVYGKFFYNRRNGVTFETGGNAYDLDAVRSEILRVGARYTMKREKWNFYGGLAYEHEFGGEATGTVDGLAIRSADIKGGSARLELGATMKPDKDSPWQLDLNLAGFAGKKQGFTGGVSVSFMF